MTSTPSDKAKAAAATAATADPEFVYDIDAALAAAHDPALGLDRSVCLRDVVEALWKVRGEAPEGMKVGLGFAAGFIEREFGSEG